jgi:4-methylaminobutanoate oxidase (formaldehyde-forming)
VLGRLTSADLDDAAFPFMTAQDIAVGTVPVRALRVTFVGELGWELYTSTEYGATLWQQLCAAGGDAGLIAGGYQAIESMRLEKGYRVWGRDITPETNPYEAGLGFCVKLDKPGGFEGRDALLAVKERGPARRLRALRMDDVSAVVLGSEAVRVGDHIVGRVTSGGVGYSVGAAIAYAYLPVDLAAVGTPIAIDLFGEWVTGAVASEPLFDPRGDRIHSR